jgi:hypothetical protein
MPEPFTLTILGLGKLFAMHSAHAAATHAVVGSTAAGVTTAGSTHIAAVLFTGVAIGTTVYAICLCLEKLVKHGVFSEKQAKAYKEKAMASDEPTRKEMLRDAQNLCDKYGC